jgi:hypothetical protein
MVMLLDRRRHRIAGAIGHHSSRDALPTGMLATPRQGRRFH